jgi:hypothetical protein
MSGLADGRKAISPIRGRDRRAISVPLAPVKTGLSRSLMDSPPCSSDLIEGPDCTASEADSQMTSVPPAETSGSDMEGQVPDRCNWGWKLVVVTVNQGKAEQTRSRGSAMPARPDLS